MSKLKKLTEYIVKLTNGESIAVKADEMTVSHHGIIISFTIHDGPSRHCAGWKFPSYNVLYVRRES